MVTAGAVATAPATNGKCLPIMPTSYPIRLCSDHPVALEKSPNPHLIKPKTGNPMRVISRPARRPTSGLGDTPYSRSATGQGIIKRIRLAPGPVVCPSASRNYWQFPIRSKLYFTRLLRQKVNTLPANHHDPRGQASPRDDAYRTGEQTTSLI
jgi:hypothetical protein